MPLTLSLDQADLRVASLSVKHPTAFDLSLSDADLTALAADLGFLGLRKLRFGGEIAPEGKHGWHLTATLGATLSQACVVTLAPVTTRIETTLDRRYLPARLLPTPEAEAEIPDDDTVEELGDSIDLAALVAEALALAAPDYPRAEGAALQETSFAEEGVTPMTDDDAKPFAGLKALRDSLSGQDD